MAAVHVATTRAAADFPLFAGHGGSNIKAAYGAYTIGTALEVNSTVDICHLPKGATIIGGMLQGSDLDTGTEALEIDVGTRTKGDAYDAASADPDALLNSGVLSGDTVAEHVTTARLCVHLAIPAPITLTVDTTVFLTITAAAAATGTGTVWVRIDYVVP
jgi:hypothetical protein